MSDFIPTTRDVLRDGEPLMKVRGLNLSDMSILVNRYFQEIKLLFSMLQDAPANEIVPRLLSADFLLRMVTEAPGFAAVLISMGCDGAYSEAGCAKMPIGIQLKAIELIGGLTLEDAGGPKELAALIRKLTDRRFQGAADGRNGAAKTSGAAGRPFLM
jgi:hypothetical protein